jgi:hypothetical protein
MSKQDRDNRIQNRPNEAVDRYESERLPDRPKRVPLHLQKTFTSYEKPGFVRFWANEWGNNIESLLLAGWVPVRGKENNNADDRQQQDTQMGSVVRQSINQNSPNALARSAILMEIPQELYDEDKEAQRKERQAVLQQIHPNNIKKSYDGGKSSGDIYGHMNITSD